MEIPNQYIKGLYHAVITLLFILVAFFAVKTIAEIKSYGVVKGQPVNTITLTGHGEVQAVPDIADVSFTITKDAKTVKDAQAAVAVVEKSALDFLKQNSVADKDIQTTDSSFNPTYETKHAVCPIVPLTPPTPFGSAASGVISTPTYYCGNDTQVITGYEAYESVTVKVRNTDTVGTIIQGLGTVGVSNLNGPNFTIDNPDALQAQAQKKAIDDAKTKAKALAGDLGVSLGSVTSFSASGAPYPIMYAKDAMATSAMAPATAPAQIPKGQNTISSDVTITYEIK
jgi:hypothetical protein